MSYPEQLYNNFQKAKTLSEYSLSNTDKILSAQDDGRYGYLSSAIFATTGSNVYTDDQTINGNLTINGDINAQQFLVTTMSVNHYTASTNFGLDSEDTHRFTGSVFISGATEFGGNLVPKEAQGATLGTSDRPFAEIFISSGSLNIASDTPGQPNTSLSNISGNILVSAGGMKLTEPGNSFIAETGSFQYISGSMTQVGNYTQLGTHILTGNSTISGSLLISGSTTQIGNNTLTGMTVLSGSVEISGSTIVYGTTTFRNHSTTITGSLNVTGSTTQTGNNTLIGNTQLTGSLGVSGSVYVNGNKQYNYGAFYDTTTQSGSINTAYPMKLNTTDMGVGVSVVSGSRITVSNSGTYNLQFSAQMVLTNTGTSDISIWLRKDGTNVAGSAGDVTIERTAGGGKTIAAWNYLVQLNANQYVELMWSTTNANTHISYISTQTNPTRPETPSLIATLTQIA